MEVDRVISESQILCIALASQEVYSEYDAFQGMSSNSNKECQNRQLSETQDVSAEGMLLRPTTALSIPYLSSCVKTLFQSHAKLVFFFHLKTTSFQEVQSQNCSLILETTCDYGGLSYVPISH